MFMFCLWIIHDVEMFTFDVWTIPDDVEITIAGWKNTHVGLYCSDIDQLADTRGIQKSSLINHLCTTASEDNDVDSS